MSLFEAQQWHFSAMKEVKSLEDVINSTLQATKKNLKSIRQQVELGSLHMVYITSLGPGGPPPTKSRRHRRSVQPSCRWRQTRRRRPPSPQEWSCPSRVIWWSCAMERPARASATALHHSSKWLDSTASFQVPAGVKNVRPPVLPQEHVGVGNAAKMDLYCSWLWKDLQRLCFALRPCRDAADC